MKHRDIIHPRRRFSCITAVYGFKVAKFELPQNSNVQKTSFPLGLPYERHRWPQEFHKNLTHPVLMDWLSRLQN